MSSELAPAMHPPRATDYIRGHIDEFVHRYFDTRPSAIVELPELVGSHKLRAAGLPLFTLVDFAGH